MFTSADPAKDDSNLYRYVKNNPVNAVDPIGLQEEFQPKGPATPPHLRKIGEPYLDHDEDSGKLVTRRHLINDEDAVVLSEMLRKLKIDGLELSDEQLVSVGNRLDQARYFEGTFRSDTALKLRWEVEADLKRWSREQKLIEREATVALGQLNKFDPRVQRIADWARRTSESEKRAIEGIHQSGAGATSTFLQTMLQRALTIVERGLQTGMAVGTAPDVVLEGAIEQIDAAGEISRDAHAESAAAGVVLFVAELSNFARLADSVEERTLRGETLTEEERNAAQTEGAVGGVLLAGDFLTLFAKGGPLSNLAGSSEQRVNKVLNKLQEARRGSGGIPGNTPSTAPIQSLKRPAPAKPSTSKLDDGNVAPDNVFRGDANLTSQLNSKGVLKSFLNEVGDLVPANATGDYKGRQVSIGEHILGGYRRGAKSNSPYTSFTPDGQIAGAYGGQTVTVDVNALRAAIARGELMGVEILDQAATQQAIRNDVLLSDHWKNLASRWAARDQEVLIRGVIPKRFIKVE